MYTRDGDAIAIARSLACGQFPERLRVDVSGRQPQAGDKHRQAEAALPVAIWHTRRLAPG